MEARDLTKGPPRRWCEETGGIKWLPRLIDKTRAALNGTLGPYLYGQSPVDASLLKALGVRYRDFTEIVRAAPDDIAVVAALEARTPEGVERARRWSAKMPGSLAWFYWGLDVDDGYVPSGLRFLKGPMNLATNACMTVLKAARPSRALEPPRTESAG